MNKKKLKGLPDFYASLSISDYFRYAEVGVDLTPDEEHVTIRFITDNHDEISITMDIPSFEVFAEKVSKAMDYIREKW